MQNITLEIYGEMYMFKILCLNKNKTDQNACTLWIRPVVIKMFTPYRILYMYRNLLNFGLLNIKKHVVTYGQ